jgi:hypothetical protein
MAKRHDRKRNLNPTARYDTRHRTSTNSISGASTNLDSNGEHKRPQLDFDVVPHIPIGPIQQIVSSIFGPEIFQADPDSYPHNIDQRRMR